MALTEIVGNPEVILLAGTNWRMAKYLGHRRPRKGYVPADRIPDWVSGALPCRGGITWTRPGLFLTAVPRES